jgi:hypothetical protein
MDVVSKLQQKIVDTYNMRSSCQVTVDDLRRAAPRHPNIAFWVKYNRARQGQLKVGDDAPAVPLFRAANAECTKVWSDTAGKTTVVFAGSLS